jgi:hypothetical protein
MLAMEDMANVNTTKVRDRCKVCMKQKLGNIVHWLLELILLLQVNTITAVVYGAAAEHNQQRVSLRTRTSAWVSGNLVSEILNRFCPATLLLIQTG